MHLGSKQRVLARFFVAMAILLQFYGHRPYYTQQLHDYGWPLRIVTTYVGMDFSQGRAYRLVNCPRLGEVRYTAFRSWLVPKVLLNIVLSAIVFWFATKLLTAGATRLYNVFRFKTFRLADLLAFATIVAVICAVGGDLVQQRLLRQRLLPSTPIDRLKLMSSPREPGVLACFERRGLVGSISDASHGSKGLGIVPEPCVLDRIVGVEVYLMPLHTDTPYPCRVLFVHGGEPQTTDISRFLAIHDVEVLGLPWWREYSTELRIDSNSRLRELLIDRSRVDREAIRSIASLEGLEVLDASDTNVDDDLLVALRTNSSIRVLRLQGTEISDDSLDSLLAMAGLEIVCVEKTRITAHGIDRLRRRGLTVICGPAT